tara:strand:- start:46755 stop:47228 length:474 start_codon:yes stop_codon:yes gene_type:complete
MSTVIARRIASTPVRTASQTWELIVDLLAPSSDSDARRELEMAAGAACSSISSEATKDAPIVIWGAGPRVRVYCVFDDDAITGDRVNEAMLSRCPTDGDWSMSIPCLPEDIDWSKKKLASVSSRITARSRDDDVDGDDSSESTASGLSVNVEEFMQS